MEENSSENWIILVDRSLVHFIIFSALIKVIIINVYGEYICYNLVHGKGIIYSRIGQLEISHLVNME